MSASPTTLIIGGGIAGLATAWALSRDDRQQRVVLLEAEPLTFSHSSARNAAIYRPLEEHASTSWLAARSLPLLEELGAGTELMQRTGLLLAATDGEALAPLTTTARVTGTAALAVEGAQLTERAPLLRGGVARCGIFLSSGGILDVHAMGEHLRKQSIALGVQLLTGRKALELLARDGRVVGARLDDGQVVQSERLVIAAGAWSGHLGASIGCPLPLLPHRRHLATLAVAQRPGPVEPVCWNVESGVYFRREGDGFLACPGDHEPHAPGMPHVAPHVIETLATRLPDFSPSLKRAQLKRAWACLRTMTPDNEAVVGADPRIRGLFWVTGLGGFGMSGGLAAGQLLSRAMAGERDPLLGALDPGRLLRYLDGARRQGAAE